MDKCCPKCFRKYPHSVERCEDDGSYLFIPGDKDLTGEVLDGRYTVLECIGRGGMGVVYKAEQAMLKRIVALKVLRREIVQDEQSVKRFMREAQAIASLKCRYTITVHDFGVTKEGLLYYTMELLEGEPLSSVILNQGALNPYRAARLILQTCESLKEAHQLGILHRDLKPDNLFLLNSEETEEVRVVDFGIAKLIDESAKEAMTNTGMIIGTPRYLSPEQALGNEVVPASDMYSLAICFYEMLAGVPPFMAETPMKTMWAHIRDPVPLLRDLNPGVEVPKNVELFLETALQKEPQDRYQSAVEFRDALRRALEEHSASPETVSLGPLATTDEGLRVLTRVWDARKSNTEGGGVRPKVLDTAADGGTGLLPGEEEAGVPAFATPRVTSSGITGRHSPAAGTVTAPSRPKATTPSQMTPQELEGMGHAMTMVAPNLETIADAIKPKFPVWKVAAASAGFLMLCGLGLLVWQPWQGAGPGGRSESVAGTTSDAKATQAATATKKTQVATVEDDVATVVHEQKIAEPVEQTGDPASQERTDSSAQTAEARPSAPDVVAVPVEVSDNPEGDAVTTAEQPAGGTTTADEKEEEQEERAADLKKQQEEQLKAEAKARRSAQVKKLLEKARVSLKNKNYEDALSTLEKVARLDSHNSEVKKLKAQCRNLKAEEEARAREAKELEELKFGEGKKDEKKKEKDELEQLKF